MTFQAEKVDEVNELQLQETADNVVAVYEAFGFWRPSELSLRVPRMDNVSTHENCSIALYRRSCSLPRRLPRRDEVKVRIRTYIKAPR